MESVEKRRLVLDALKSVPQDASRDEREYLAMVQAEELLSMTNDASLPMRLFEADRFVARVARVDYEESSTRYILTLADRNGAVETIRTDRTDRQFCEQIKAMVKASIGKVCLVYKVYEEMKNQEGRKVRIALYVRPLHE